MFFWAEQDPEVAAPMISQDSCVQVLGIRGVRAWCGEGGDSYLAVHCISRA